MHRGGFFLRKRGFFLRKRGVLFAEKWVLFAENVFVKRLFSVIYKANFSLIEIYIFNSKFIVRLFERLKALKVFSFFFTLYGGRQERALPVMRTTGNETRLFRLAPYVRAREDEEQA